MKKKGFTLIELLAVIVILAIIALIATPLVLKYIEKSRKESKVDSAYSFVRNLETEIANYSIQHNGKKYNKSGLLEIGDFTEIDTTVKGDNPNTIKVCLSSLGQVEKGIFEYNEGKYYVLYDGKKGSISDKDAYDNFSCSTVAKIEVPEATGEIDFVAYGINALGGNNQGIIYSGLEDEESDYFFCSYVSRFAVPTKLFTENFPEDKNTIEAEITFLDGSKKQVNFIKNEDGEWVYNSDIALPYFTGTNNDDILNDWSITIRPNHDIDDNENTNYHYFIRDIYEAAHGFQALKILGTTLYFNNVIVNDFSTIDKTNDDHLLPYTDFDSLEKVIITYEDDSQDVYEIKEENHNPESYDEIGVRHGNRLLYIENEYNFNIKYYDSNPNYTDDVLKDIPKVKLITVVENGKMKTYKISDNPSYYYGDLGE